MDGGYKLNTDVPPCGQQPNNNVIGCLYGLVGGGPSAAAAVLDRGRRADHLQHRIMWRAGRARRLKNVAVSVAEELTM